MISTLHIKNIGIIEDLTVDLNTGFNVLTGETGAGKTLIIDSLNLACGGRFSKEIVRRGENFCLVELNIYLPQNENSIDGNIIISREIFLNGRNTCKINGRLVTVNELKEFMSKIIDIHGQNDNQTIMSKQEHINYLDNFIGKDLLNEKYEYQKLYNRYNEIKKELKENYGDEKEKQRKLDLLKYQLNEIEQANLKENEEDELNNERKKIMNSEKIYTCLTEVDSNLSESVIDGINLSIRALEKIEDIDDEYKNKLTDLKNIYYDVQELTRDISDLNSDVSFDESKRNEIEERLDCIYDLKRKYGNSISEIIEYKEQIEKDIYTIENLEEHNNKLKKELEDLTIKMSEKCSVLNKMRSKYSKVLNEKINKELKDLEMKNASFCVDIKYDESGNFNQNGLDDIEFLIATNVGDEAKPLIKIASGGEISRIMLAIKTVLADTDEVPILIFDEIDTGISGKAAKSVGEKIKIISQKHQVLCITHQANIAAKGDSNYFISKKVENEKTYTNIKLLNEAEVIEEIARISSGDITKNALEHAREMRLSK
ncbi:MAG TPA: DNA repair protein RecN [Clostridiaceae bacterium]|jgi:DNA repair protein RecN|nr:DNA repair protein RecN [Clostridiaceae bacterium]